MSLHRSCCCDQQGCCASRCSPCATAAPFAFSHGGAMDVFVTFRQFTSGFIVAQAIGRMPMPAGSWVAHGCSGVMTYHGEAVGDIPDFIGFYGSIEVALANSTPPLTEPHVPKPPEPGELPGQRILFRVRTVIDAVWDRAAKRCLVNYRWSFGEGLPGQLAWSCSMFVEYLTSGERCAFQQFQAMTRGSIVHSAGGRLALEEYGPIAGAVGARLPGAALWVLPTRVVSGPVISARAQTTMSLLTSGQGQQAIFAPLGAGDAAGACPGFDPVLSSPGGSCGCTHDPACGSLVYTIHTRSDHESAGNGAGRESGVDGAGFTLIRSRIDSDGCEDCACALAYFYSSLTWAHDPDDPGFGATPAAPFVFAPDVQNAVWPFAMPAVYPIYDGVGVPAPPGSFFVLDPCRSISAGRLDSFGTPGTAHAEWDIRESIIGRSLGSAGQPWCGVVTSQCGPVGAGAGAEVDL